jgi:hypothetical protein
LAGLFLIFDAIGWSLSYLWCNWLRCLWLETMQRIYCWYILMRIYAFTAETANCLVVTDRASQHSQKWVHTLQWVYKFSLKNALRSHASMIATGMCGLKAMHWCLFHHVLF